MKPGDLVKYNNNNRIPKIFFGIILNKESEDSWNFKYYKILCEDGRIRLKSDHYLELINEQ